MLDFRSVFQPRRVLTLAFTALAVCVMSAAAQQPPRDQPPNPKCPCGNGDGDGGGHGRGHAFGHEKHHNKSNPTPHNHLRASFSAAEAVATYSQTTARALELGGVVDRFGRQLPARSQLELLDVLSNRGAPVDRLAAALAPEGNRQARGEALRVARSLRGLAEDPTRLTKAAEAYNRFIGNSSAAFLAAPPPELLVVEAVLSPMVDKAMAAYGSSSGDLAAQ